MSDHPPIQVPARPMCPPHYADLVPEHHPSGVAWQVRYAVVMTAILNRFLEDPRVLAGGSDQDMEGLLARSAPLCCFVGPEALQFVRRYRDEAIRRIEIGRTS